MGLSSTGNKAELMRRYIDAKSEVADVKTRYYENSENVSQEWTNWRIHLRLPNK